MDIYNKPKHYKKWSEEKSKKRRKRNESFFHPNIHNESISKQENVAYKFQQEGTKRDSNGTRWARRTVWKKEGIQEING